MAIFRKIHTSFWSDTFIQDLDNDHKLFYLYILTNERTKQCGIYEISKKQISFDLGYSIDRVSKLLQYFIKTDKILYSEITKELAIKNWNKFNSSTSPKVVSCIKSELSNVKDRVLIEYVNGIYIASQEEQEEEQEEEKNKNNIDERKLKFATTLKPFLDLYGKELLNDFYAYWTEPNKSNTKLKFELEKTWGLERRLNTWAKNDKNFNKKQNGTETRTTSQNNAIDQFRERIISSITK
jgi:hypothetical protein